jgi:hypothetical protein
VEEGEQEVKCLVGAMDEKNTGHVGRIVENKDLTSVNGWWGGRR